MEHDGNARLTFSPTSKLVLPALRNLDEALRLDPDLRPRHAMHVVTRPLVIGLRALGLDVVRRDGLELLEHMLRRGIVAGATDMTNYLETELLDQIFKNTAIFPSPTSVYIALYTSDPGETGSEINEVSDSGTAYAREQVVTTGAAWTVTGNAVTNLSDVDFGTATANWGTVTHMAITDNAVRAAGNHFLNGALAAAKTVNNGDSFKFAAGDIDVTFD